MNHSKEEPRSIRARLRAGSLAVLLSLGGLAAPSSHAAPLAGAVPGEGYPHPVLADVRVRQAVADCTDRDTLAASVYGYMTPVQRQALRMDTFLPAEHWAHVTPSQTYSYNPALGRQLLDQAGWTLGPGAQYRTNAAGRSLEFGVTTTTSAFRTTYLTLLQSQLAECGIRLTVLQTAADWFFGATTGLVRREFDTAVFAWVGEADPRGRTLYGCDWIPNPASAWVGQNYMGWCNDSAQAALLQATDTLTHATRLAGYTTFQEAFAADMVSLPLFRRAVVHGTDRNLTGFAPSPYLTAYTWNANTWSLPPYTLITIGMTQEPATLFAMQDFSSAGEQVRALVEGLGAALPASGMPQPILYDAIPSVENGGIVVQAVNVTAGDVVADEDGNIQPLANGMRLLTSAGERVTYQGGTVSLPQAVITAAFRSGLFWSNGSPLVQADLQLWDSIQCNPVSSLRTAYCADVAQRAYLNATTVRTTLVPGDRPQEIWSYLPGAYPSQRVVSDGRLLQNVPAAEWPTLTEVTRTPIGLGPYRLVSWDPGVRMVFAANAYYALGAPVTPYLEIRFFADSDTLTNSLVGGQVDVVAADSGPNLNTLLAADEMGQARAVFEATTTWEHLDFNLSQFYRVRLPSLQR